MKRFSLSQKLRYWFDNTMAKGTVALIGWLAILSTILISVISLVVLIIAPSKEDGSSYTFTELVWMGLMRSLDAGTMGGDTGSVPFLGSMLAVTFGGIFIFSTLVGVLSAGIDSTLDKLRKGRSLVVENDHTVILGWSEHVLTIISELVIANENRKRPCIVIMADRDKVEMEDEIREKIPSLKNTRVVCRTGDPIDLIDIEMVNLPGARSIIVLSPTGEEQDSQVIKIILAITNNPNRRAEPYHIVAEIKDKKNLEVARIISKDEVEIIETSDIISRIIAQTCRQSGLSVVYNELLDFGGDEIYFQEVKQLVGKSYGESISAFEGCSVMGLHFKNGQTLLNPPMDTIIKEGDQIVAIAEDDDKIIFSGWQNNKVDESAFHQGPTVVPEPEKTLILGWNERAPMIINELDNYVAPGSSILVVADYAEGKEELERRCNSLKNETVYFQVGDTTDRSVLDSVTADNYKHVIVLCYSDTLEPQRADARTLVTLLHLRDIESKQGESFSIVSEMSDERNRELAKATNADDFIVSDRLISLLFSQISENKNLTAVFNDIFDADGSEIYLKPAQDYVELGKPISYYTILESARRRNHTAIGYSIFAERHNAENSYGVKINPHKLHNVTFSENDRIVVLAEN